MYNQAFLEGFFYWKNIGIKYDLLGYLEEVLKEYDKKLLYVKEGKYISVKKLSRWYYYIKISSEAKKVWLAEIWNKKIRWFKKTRDGKYVIILKLWSLRLWDLLLIEYEEKEDILKYHRLLMLSSWEDVKNWLWEKANIIWEWVKRLKDEVLVQVVVTKEVLKETIKRWNIVVWRTVKIAKDKVCEKVWEERCKKIWEALEKVTESFIDVKEKIEDIPWWEVMELLWEGMKYGWAWTMMWWWTVCAGWISIWTVTLVGSAGTMTVPALAIDGWACAIGWMMTVWWWVMYMVWDGFDKLGEKIKEVWGSWYKWKPKFNRIEDTPFFKKNNLQRTNYKYGKVRVYKWKDGRYYYSDTLT